MGKHSHSWFESLGSLPNTVKESALNIFLLGIIAMSCDKDSFTWFPFLEVIFSC